MLPVARKEFRQVRRDRRTLVMMLALPILLLVVFGYAASFNVTSMDVEVVGPQAEQVAGQVGRLGGPQGLTVDVVDVDPSGTARSAEADLRDNRADVAIVTGGDEVVALIDGSQLFTAQAAVTGLAQAPFAVETEVLFNPGLETAAYMVPAIIGLILVFIGTMITSLGVVRERETGTLEQLAVMPFHARDIIAGKLLPYYAIGLLDLVVVTAVGVVLFDVPFTGPVWQLVLGGVVFLTATMAIGVLISTLSENQGQAIQMALMVTLPQVLLSGMVFPLESMAAGVRWIAWFLPLTYWVAISRDVMLKGTDFTAMWEPYAALVVLGGVVLALALVRFRRDLGPSRRERRRLARRAEATGAGDGDAA